MFDHRDHHPHSTPPAIVPGEVPAGGGRYSQSLSSGLSILTSFDGESSSLGIAELAGKLGMSRSTAHRYAATLAALGYLEQDAGRQYRLTPRAADPGLAVLESISVRTRSRSLLGELREQTGRTVSIAILYGTEIMLMNRLRGWRGGLCEIDLRLGAAARLPLFCTAMGKVLLAYLPASERERRVEEMTFHVRGPRTVTDKRELGIELERVRAEGLAIDNEELTSDMYSLAVPVLDADGQALAAIDLAMPVGECSPEQLTEFADRLRVTAKQIAARLRQTAA